MAKRDSILAHCVARGLLVWGGVKPDASNFKMRKALRLVPRSSRVAALIALWATALIELERDQLGIEEYVEWAPDSRATVYRELKDFRELWPEFDTPNELAALVVRTIERDGTRAAPSPLLAIAV